ncbi:capsule biosynthesis protein [Pseudanabaena sp. UWO310]|uniref:capsule biosynthesis protein n=1 Tax=Pseudanabaena sp. UWO310 TaxID=2480795 RepID=UPI001157BC30|nr:capsule biosynthesis protein [Pseudanabaena sp. UWO310]TYQ25772.1 capsule biosynthesis protein [Pseudanabaena sp. UWO310]
MQNSLKIIFFAPHTAIWVHAFPEALIAEALQQEGHEVIYITCGEVFNNYCICMSAFGLSQESSTIDKKNICITCNTNKKVIRQNFHLEGYDLIDKLTLDDVSLIESTISKVTKENFLDLSIENIEIGRFALYEVLLKYKKSNLVFSDDEWSSYLTALKNTLSSFIACRHILEQEKPDRIITYNSLYSVNRVFLELAKRQNISTYFLHAGANLSDRLETVLIGKNSTFAFYQELLNYWDIYQNQACSQKLIKKVTDHVLSLLDGQHFLVYSSPRKGKPIDIRFHFGIQENQKILVATMSSYDEIFAAETVGVISNEYDLIFPKQIDWIKSLVDFAESRPDLFLIVRVHPREFPNRRDSVKSAHALAIQELLQNLPKNVRANYPSDNISLYDLAEHTNLFLNAWSSAGEEVSFLGIPVVIYSRELVSYPPDLHYVATSKNDFFSKIDEALADGWNFERMRQGYRWHVLKLERCAFNISESFTSEESSIQSRNKHISPLSIVKKFYTKARAKLSSDYKLKHNYNQRTNECQNRASCLKSRNQINYLITEGKKTMLDLPQTDHEVVSSEQEALYIKEEVIRLIKFLYRHYPSLVQANTLREKLLKLINE